MPIVAACVRVEKMYRIALVIPYPCNAALTFITLPAGIANGVAGRLPDLHGGNMPFQIMEEVDFCHGIGGLEGGWHRICRLYKRSHPHALQELRHHTGINTFTKHAEMV